MTVPSETSEVLYTGDGVTTNFPIPFVFYEPTTIVTYLVLISTGVETQQSRGVHHDVNGGDGATGDVDFYAAPSALYQVRIVRDVTFTQGTNFLTQGNFSPGTHEKAFDASVFRDQELARRVSALESAGAPGSVIAGDGLYFSGSNLHVGAGDGIAVGADTVSVDFQASGPTGVSAAAGSVGTGLLVARDDHTHQVLTGTPGAVTAGASASAGAATTLARSDHAHSVATAAPVAVTKATAAEGVATSFSRSDHKHDVTTAAAVALTDSSNAEGSATTLARSDHTHSHGARGGDTLHAVATNLLAGFMSAADKSKLDGLVLFDGISSYMDEDWAQVGTTDGTVTTILTWAPTDQYVEHVEAIIMARRDPAEANDSASYRLMATFVRDDGVTTQVGTTTVVASHESDAAFNASFLVSSPSISLQVTGAAAKKLRWTALVRRWATQYI